MADFSRVLQLDPSDADAFVWRRALDLFPTNIRAQYGKARMNFKVNFESLLFGDAKSEDAKAVND